MTESNIGKAISLIRKGNSKACSKSNSWVIEANSSFKITAKASWKETIISRERYQWCQCCQLRIIILSMPSPQPIELKACMVADNNLPEVTVTRENSWAILAIRTTGDQSLEAPCQLEDPREWWIQNLRSCFRHKLIKIHKEWVQELKDRLTTSFMSKLLKEEPLNNKLKSSPKKKFGTTPTNRS